MLNEIKVSVIVPIYNVEEYLEKCLNSLVIQTLKDIEVLMVNDGSTDSSGEIAAEYADKYENFHLLTKPNGGLGQARNYAVPLVKGEYIAFVDSDDFVSRYTYEKLYNMSENGKHDIITGNVRRFNSKKYYNSGLHAKVFKETIKSTHITKNPELIYDTTAWNKLFKTEFWRENNFKFPEGVLYEDIPVTIPAHFKSRSTAIFTDPKWPIYYWRSRDGQNKSITQKRTDITNFTDRLSALKSVDKFMECNIDDKTCIYYKYFKWIDLDLKLYINKLDQADEDYINQFIPIVQEYIKTIPKYVFNDLRAIDRIKYYFIEKGDIKSLLEVLDFEKNRMKYLEVVQKRNKYLGKFPFKGVPEEYFEMTKELNTSFHDFKKIHKIRILNGILNIKGYCYIRRVNFDRKSKVNLKAKLVNTTNGKELPVSIQNIKIPEITQKSGVRVKDYKLRNRLYNYDWAGYHIKIDLNDLQFLELGPGEYKVIINLQMPGINKDIILGSPNRESKPEPYLAVYNKIIFKYNARGDLCFFVTEQCSGITKSYIKNNDIYFEGWFSDKTSKNELILHKNEKIPISVKINHNFEFNKLICHKFSNAVGFNVVISNNLIKNLKNGRYYLKYYKNGQVESLTGNRINKKKIFGNHLINLYISRTGDIKITKYDIKTYLKSVSWKNNDLKISTCLNKSSLGHQIIINSKLRCVSKKYGNTISIKEEDIEETEHLLMNTFVVKTNDKLFNNLFTSDDWEFYVDYRVGFNKVISHKIKVINNKFKNKSFKTHKYKLTTSDSCLCLKVSLIWPRKEKTTRKREALERYVYPLLRILPINNKRIIFESHWRNKYNCNPRYLYEHIDTNYPEYECIWVFNDESIKINGKGKKVRFQTLKYFYYMATAKYFINNANFPDFYKKRENAVEIQTMHGTPLKTLGLDVPDELTTTESLDKFIERCKRWDYLIVSSDKVADITKKCFMFNKKFLKTGYPRIDEIFQLNTSKTMADIKKGLDIPENKKVILYAPTWRVRNKFDLMLDLEKMKDSLGEEYVLLLRAHPFAAKGLKRELLNDFVIDVTGYGSIEKLYAISDMLITDYSSAMFDYAVLNKPMIFFAYDLDLYKNNLRGFYLNFEEEAPGPIVSTSNEVIEEILNSDTIKSRYNDKIDAFHRNYCQYEKGNACKNIFDNVFDKSSSHYEEKNLSKNVFNRVLKNILKF